MPSLFERGWRQGSLLRRQLSVRIIDIPEDRVFTSECWILVTQDCDLARADTTSESLVELRPVETPIRGQRIQGIASKILIVAGQFRLDAQDPRAMITARALATFEELRDNSLSSEQTREMKTWLGLRYDRPAVPDEFIPLVRAILSLIEEIGIGRSVRDVFALIEEGGPPVVDLWVVLIAAVDRDAVRAAMDSVALALPDELGDIRDIQIEDTSRTPFQVIEQWYALDSAKLSETRPEPH